MRELNVRTAAAAAAILSIATFASSLGNGFAIDDVPIIVENPAVHSIGAAWRGFFDTYWPPESGVSAGTWRPVSILSYAVDWAVSGGSPFWFHLVNVMFNALAAALAVIVLGRWLSPGPLLAAGAVFAVHPLHSEAVANVVGRGEILVAVWLFSAVLAFRSYRASRGSAGGITWGILTVAFTALAMLTKEHGVITPAVLAIDRWLDRDRTSRDPRWVAVAVVAWTLCWFHVWQAIAGSEIDHVMAAPLRGLDAGERISTALPVLFDVLRLLVWPQDLAFEYNPQVIPVRASFGMLALGALVVGASLILLALLLGLETRSHWRSRAAAAAFAILVAAGSWAPTSNLFFPSGVVLAERNLYLAVLAPAAGLGILVSLRQTRRTLQLAALVVLVLAARSALRNPFWKDSGTVIITDLLAHPVNYRNHVRIARSFEQAGDTLAAWRHYVTSAGLFPDDPFVAQYSVPAAIALGKTDWAAREADRSRRLPAASPAIGLLAVRAALADANMALAEEVALELLEAPGSGATAAQAWLEFAQAAGRDTTLAQARILWTRGQPARAAEILGTVNPQSYSISEACEAVRIHGGLIRALRPDLHSRLGDLAHSGGELQPCDIPPNLAR